MAGGSSFAVSSNCQHLSHRWLGNALLWVALHVAIAAAAEMNREQIRRLEGQLDSERVLMVFDDTYVQLMQGPLVDSMGSPTLYERPLMRHPVCFTASPWE